MFWDPLFEHVAAVSGAPASQVKVHPSPMLLRVLIHLRLDDHRVASRLPPRLDLRPHPPFTTQPRPPVLHSHLDLLPRPPTGPGQGALAPLVQLLWRLCHRHNPPRTQHALGRVHVSSFLSFATLYMSFLTASFAMSHLLYK